MSLIYHIAEEEAVQKAIATGFYQVESLISEGFIHCSTKEEVANTANRHYKGKTNLTLLEIDASKIVAPLKYENLSGGSIQYPHIYGLLNCDAILAAYQFNSSDDGIFLFPKEDKRYNLQLAENHFLQLALKLFQEQKAQGEKALAQLQDKELFYQSNEESNSIALLIQHLSGNMISRWTDFLSTDGEKQNRNRDEEFVLHIENKDTLMLKWEQGWEVLFGTLNSLTGKDMFKIIYIRGEAHSVMKAITRQIAHYAFHTGQIVYLAKQIRGEQWKTLSIARGKSNEYKPS
jgi:uncharacterized protein (DUF952 family)